MKRKLFDVCSSPVETKDQSTNDGVMQTEFQSNKSKIIKKQPTNDAVVIETHNKPTEVRIQPANDDAVVIDTKCKPAEVLNQLTDESVFVSKTKSKVAFAKRISTCRRRSARLSTSPFNPKTTITGEGSGGKNNEVSDIELDSSELNKRVVGIEERQSSTNNSIIKPIGNDLKVNSEELSVSTNPQVIPKKKKRLLSKTKFCFPQEKLISPMMKLNCEEKKKGIFMEFLCKII